MLLNGSKIGHGTAELTDGDEISFRSKSQVRIVYKFVIVQKSQPSETLIDGKEKYAGTGKSAETILMRSLRKALQQQRSNGINEEKTRNLSTDQTKMMKHMEKKITQLKAQVQDVHRMYATALQSAQALVPPHIAAALAAPASAVPHSLASSTLNPAAAPTIVKTEIESLFTPSHIRGTV